MTRPGCGCGCSAESVEPAVLEEVKRGIPGHQRRKPHLGALSQSRAKIVSSVLEDRSCPGDGGASERQGSEWAAGLTQEEGGEASRGGALAGVEAGLPERSSAPG